MGRVKYLWSEEYLGKRIGLEIPEEGDRTKPFSSDIWSGVEVVSQDRLKEIQWDKLKNLLKFAYENSQFYRERWDKAKVKPSDIKYLEDLPKIPVTTKEECGRDREEHPPYGTIATSPPHTHMQNFATSGTTGKPQRWTSTREDWETSLEVDIRGFWANGVRPGWRAYYAFGFLPFIGFWGCWPGSETLGCQNMPKGSLPTIPWLQSIKSLAGETPSLLACTPTYAIRQLEVATEIGIDPLELKIDVVLLSGEPGYGIPSTHRRIKEGWGARLMELPGSTETNGPFLYSCNFLSEEEEPSDHVASDYWLIEILDPETLEPVKPDNKDIYFGVSCITPLNKFGMPTIRYLLNDIMTLEEGKVCECGRTLPIARGGIKGRIDEVIITKGVKIYPALVEDVVRSIDGLSNEYMIIKRPDEVVISAEASPELDKGDYEKLAKLLQDKIYERAYVRLKVEVKEPGTYPKSEVKTKRIVEG